MDLETIQSYIERGYKLNVRFRVRESRYHAFVDLGHIATSHNFMAPTVKEALEGLNAYLKSQVSATGDDNG